MPVWIVAPVGDPLGDVARRCARSASVGAGGATSTSGQSASHQPTTWLTWTWLRPNVRGICAVGLEEEPGPADERRDVVGVEPEAEVAVPVRRRRPRRAPADRRCASREDVAHLAEVVRDEVDRARRGSTAG